MIKKAYYLLFYKIYCFFKYMSDDTWKEWKALLVLCVAEGYTFLTIDVWINIIFKRSIFLNISKEALVLLVVIITFLNYYLTLHHQKWKKYEMEFTQYSKLKSRVISWLVCFILFGILGALILSFYQMSLIDWSKYR